ncbi:MAG: MFS transporter [Rhodocyclaceae bacterium]
MPEIARALRHRNYRLYFVGQMFSLVGTWMQQIAMGWLTYRLTGSALLLGVVSFAGQIPILLLAPFGGLWSDRADRRRLLIGTQAAALLQAVVLAGLSASAMVQPWHLVAAALALGGINAVDIPARQSFFVQLVERREDLPNAIALNSFAMNGARLIGPAAAGLIVAALGEAVCFALNAASYLAVLIALATIRTRGATRAASGLRTALADGFRYAFGTPAVRSLLALIALTSFAATPYAVLMPAFAREVFGGGAGTFGMLMTCAGAGAVLGTVALAARRSARGLDRVIAASPFVVGGGVLVFAASGRLWLAAPALMAIGFGIISAIAGGNTAIQTLVRDELRGRVMAIFTMSFLGVAPLGALAAGAAAELFGVRATLAAGALATIAAGFAFLRVRARVAQALDQAAGLAARS